MLIIFIILDTKKKKSNTFWFKENDFIFSLDQEENYLRNSKKWKL